MHEVEVLDGAEAFALGEGPVAALLIHGFTGSPQGLRGLGAYLAARGIAVQAPRLPGHGTTWQDLDTCRTPEWTHTVEEAFSEISLERDQVFVVGLSFGAALALDLAARNPGRVCGIVTLAGMVGTRDPRRFAAPLIRVLTSSLPGTANDIADPTATEIAYDRLPTSATYLMLKFLRRARMGLAGVRSPILIMHSRNDHTVGPFNARLIYDNVSSEHKELVWLDRSYHVLTLDYDRDEVFERTFDFIERTSKRRYTP
ncbi:MAG: alpha/beta fold hydrolase [Actinomycetota bacterium]|nr:alpha/beta fold hydrolase [Actinomycetota bacterium]